MELTRSKPNTSSNMARAGQLRDMGPILMRLGKMALQYATAPKGGAIDNSSFRLPSISIADTGGSPRRRKRRKGQQRPNSGGSEGIPRSVPGGVIRRKIHGTRLLQTDAGGSLALNLNVGYSSSSSGTELVNTVNLQGTDWYLLSSHGFLKYHKVTVTIKPSIPATSSAYAVGVLRNNIDNTVATPSYINSVNGSKWSNFRQDFSYSIVPSVEHGVIFKPVNTEASGSDDVKDTKSCTCYLWAQINPLSPSTVIGLMQFEIDVSMWNN